MLSVGLWVAASWSSLTHPQFGGTSNTEHCKWVCVGPSTRIARTRARLGNVVCRDQGMGSVPQRYLRPHYVTLHKSLSLDLVELEVKTAASMGSHCSGLA